MVVLDGGVHGEELVAQHAKVLVLHNAPRYWHHRRRPVVHVVRDAQAREHLCELVLVAERHRLKA